MSKVKIEIKSWLNGSVLFEYESENATMKKAVEAAIDGNANLSGANLSGANLRDADLSGATIHYSDNDFDSEYMLERFMRYTQLESVETEMQHNTRPSKWRLTWKNVLKIKSWKLKPTDGSFEVVSRNISAASKAIAESAKSQSNDDKCAQSEKPEVKVGDRVAFKHGDEPTEALCGDVIATKGSEAVVEVSLLLGSRVFILAFDELIVVPPKAEEQSED